MEARNAWVAFAYIVPALSTITVGTPLATTRPAMSPELCMPTLTRSLTPGEVSLPTTCMLFAAFIDSYKAPRTAACVVGMTVGAGVGDELAAGTDAGAAGAAPALH